MESLSLRVVSNRLSFNIFVSWIVVLTLLLAFFFIIHGKNPLMLEEDEKEYVRIAEKILQGNWKMEKYRRTLGHPLVLAGLLFITDHHWILFRCMLIALVAGLVPLAGWIAWKITNSELSFWLASLLLIFWPPYIYYAISVYSECTSLLVFFTYLSLLLVSPVYISSWRLFFSGIILGICLQFRPMYVIWLFFIPIVAWLQGVSFKGLFRYTGCIWVGVALIVLPWSVMVSYHAGKFILLSANGGETLAGGMNPALLNQSFQDYQIPNQRDAWVGPGKWINEADTTYLSSDELKLPDLRRDELLKQRAVLWAWNHPWEALKLEFYKLGYMWGLYPWDSSRVHIFLQLCSTLLLICGITSGICLWNKGRVEVVPFMALVLFSSAVALISWGSWRFRLPADVGLLILVASYLGFMRRNSTQF